jgi:hypothetical protein
MMKGGDILIEEHELKIALLRKTETPRIRDGFVDRILYSKIL